MNININTIIIFIVSLPTSTFVCGNHQPPAQHAFFQNGSTIRPLSNPHVPIHFYLSKRTINLSLSLSSLNSLILVHFSSNLETQAQLERQILETLLLRYLAPSAPSPGRWCERLGLSAAAWLRREQKMSGRGRRSALGVGDRDFANKSAGIQNRINTREMMMMIYIYMYMNLIISLLLCIHTHIYIYFNQSFV